MNMNVNIEQLKPLDVDLVNFLNPSVPSVLRNQILDQIKSIVTSSISEQQASPALGIVRCSFLSRVTYDISNNGFGEEQTIRISISASLLAPDASTSKRLLLLCQLIRSYSVTRLSKPEV